MYFWSKMIYISIGTLNNYQNVILESTQDGLRYIRNYYTYTYACSSKRIAFIQKDFYITTYKDESKRKTKKITKKIFNGDECFKIYKYIIDFS